MQEFYFGIDFKGNNLVNYSDEVLSELPVTGNFTGRKVIVNQIAYTYLNGEFRASATELIDNTDSVPALSIDTTTTPGSRIWSLAQATNTQDGLLSAALFALISNATPDLVNGTLVLRNDTGSFKTGTPVNPEDVVSKSYVDNLLSDGIALESDIDCSTNPQYPVATKGMMFIVAAAGKIGGSTGIDVAEQDAIICKADNPIEGDQATSGDNFFILEHNAQLANNIKAGLVRFATSAEVDAGVSTDTVPSIADVVAMMSQASGAGVSASIPSGTSTFSMNHQINGFPIVSMYTRVDRNLVQAAIEVVDADNLLVHFAPNSSEVIDIAVTYGGPFLS